MVCESYGNVIVCGPPRGVYKRIESRSCFSCEREHGFIERWDGAYYGSTLYGSCGDIWQDGYRFERPFARYWRRDRQRQFEALWGNAATSDLYERYVRADVDVACSEGVALDEAFTRRSKAHEAIKNAQKVES